jgi:predicted CXXCH cytochrome family protein
VPHLPSGFRKRSHMPLLEDKIECTDGHGPHGSTADALLHADSIHELAYARSAARAASRSRRRVTLEIR